MVKTISLVAVKGGVGKTLTTINFARRLADKFNVKVGLVDADFDNANFAQFTNIDAELKIVDSKEYSLYDWDGIQVFSMSLIAGRKKSVSMTGDRYTQMLHDVLNQANWNVDYFVVDLPSGSSDIFRSVMQLFGDTVAGNIVITQPSMTDALNRVLNLHRYFEIPVLGVIENMSYFRCGKCEEMHYPFGKSDSLDITKEFGVDLIGRIPLSQTVSEMIGNGVAMMEPDLLSTIDDICQLAIEAPVVKTGIFRKLVVKLEEKIQKIIEGVLIKIIVISNKEMDFKEMRREIGFTERKICRMTITDESMMKELTRVDLRLEDKGIRVIKDVEKPDFEIVLDFKTLSRVVMRKRKINGGIEFFDSWDAWLNGDMKAYGYGYSPKVIQAFRQIFSNDEVMSQTSEKYKKILERFI